MEKPPAIMDPKLVQRFLVIAVKWREIDIG
jgi:hypothetical protein